MEGVYAIPQFNRSSFAWLIQTLVTVPPYPPGEYAPLEVHQLCYGFTNVGQRCVRKGLARRLPASCWEPPLGQLLDRRYVHNSEARERF